MKRWWRCFDISPRGRLARHVFMLSSWVFFAVLAASAFAADGGEITMDDAVRKYMYFFLGAGGAVVVMIIATSYMTRLTIALKDEIKVRKQTERALRESVDRFQYIVECSGDWIWETDAEGRYTYTSGIVSDMLGYEPEDVLGRQQHEFFTTGEKEGFVPLAKEFYASRKKIFRQRLRLVTKEGRVVIHQTTAEPMLDAKGELLGYRGVNRDVTKEVSIVQL